MSESRFAAVLFVLLVAAFAYCAEPVPNLVGQLDRPLRYKPDNGDFVIEGGEEFFNRPLYGGNTAFRVDAGDKPEFTLYLPGRGGNLRLGIRSKESSKWLSDAAHVVARYRPGCMLYEIRDPLLGSDGVLKLTVLALNSSDGLIVRAETASVADIELVWAFGGANGQRGQRDGDIGTERVPISEYFQLKPEFCQGNTFELGEHTFTMRSKPATIVGSLPPGSTQAIAGAAHWSSFEKLLASKSADRPVVIGHVPLVATVPLFIAIARAEKPLEDLSRFYEETDAHFKQLRERVSIQTPDPYIDAAVGALNVAADAVWDEPQGVVMHGAIAWRRALLGWRGPYCMDALARHDRARKHLAYWAKRQNTDAIPEKLPPADENSNWSRSEKALHSNGDMSNTHYDMNKVYIDALLRHLLWTGDLEFAKQVWPVIQRHIAWERRLFRREFGPDQLPLYEAYADIWASDDIQYHGGGVSYASAYNYWHNKMAGRLARLLGDDPAPYEREAELIAKAMRRYLWLEDQGSFAEFKDLLGNQRVHPSSGLWSFYHTMDSELPTPAEAWRMSAAVQRALRGLPIRGVGVPTDRDYHVFASTDWMPYSWSVNNVVMGENIHTALGLWQAGRADDAFTLTKSALLASMYMGICPGNIGSMNYLDVYRRESQRDFGDGSGVLSRALVEGLFGVRPDALAGEMRIVPGLPSDWKHAALTHPDIQLKFARDGTTDHWTIAGVGPRFRSIRLRLPATHERVASVELNGAAITGKLEASVAARPMFELVFPGVAASEVTIHWDGAVLPAPAATSPPTSLPSRGDEATVNWRDPRLDAKFDPVDLTGQFNDRVTKIFERGKYRSPRSPFVSLALPAQGIGAWAGHVNDLPEIDDAGLRRIAGEKDGRLLMPNGVPLATPGPGDAPNILFTSQWGNYPRESKVPLAGRAAHVFLLMAGSTNFMQSRIDNGEVVVAYADGSSAKLPLHNPTTWWPIEQDYFIDDYQFRRPGPIPPRVNLKTGEIRLLDEQSFKGRGRSIPGGAATVLDLPLDPAKELRSLTVRSLANEVVIGLMSVTLERPKPP